MITKPPKYIAAPFNKLHRDYPDQFQDYLQYHSTTDTKGRYLHFHEFKHRLFKGADAQLAWSITKTQRLAQAKPLLPIRYQNHVYKASYCSTPVIQAAISEIDRHTTTAALEWMCTKLGEQSHLSYLLSDLIEDEAISSSQLEGAATTTLVAKAMIKNGRKPRSPDEKMILGNYKMMQYAWEQRHKPLSLELILTLHRIGVEGINDDAYSPGAVRTTDNVQVVDADGNTVHTPPPANGLEERLQYLADWVNQAHHDALCADYVHPLLKAISLHFAIGYEHPFYDGNGRVARALFYWYLFKNDFAAFRYIAISLLLKNAPVQYGKSYLYTETDGMDLTYFIEHQCQVIVRAINKFKSAYNQSLSKQRDFDKWLWDSDLLSTLSEKQKVILNVARSDSTLTFTATSIQNSLGCAYNTANTALNGLVTLGLFTKEKAGKTWVFRMSNR